MPRKNPTVSYTLIRQYAEKFKWKDKHGKICRGFQPPEDAYEVERISFSIRFVKASGEIVSGEVICISVKPNLKMRLLKFVNSEEIRWVRDYLIIEIDGVRFTTH